MICLFGLVRRTEARPTDVPRRARARVTSSFCAINHNAPTTPYGSGGHGQASDETGVKAPIGYVLAQELTVSK